MSAVCAPVLPRPRLVALGDSITCGEGVGVHTHPALTWTSVVAHSLGAHVDLFATRGARIRDVRTTQVPAAVAHTPDIATIVIGLNDVSRGGWDPVRMRTDLLAAVGRLHDSGATVLLGRLHDPTRFLPMPTRVRTRVLDRIATVNAAVDEAARADVLVLDLGAISALGRRGCWAVDRVHPSIAGHRAIAEAALDVLEASHVAVARRVGIPAAASRPSRFAELSWLARYGAPYLLRNLDRVRQPATLTDARSRE